MLDEVGACQRDCLLFEDNGAEVSLKQSTAVLSCRDDGGDT